jgi:hypothetical protein
MHACLGQRQPYCMLEADAIMRGLSIFYIYAYAATTAMVPCAHAYKLLRKSERQ